METSQLCLWKDRKRTILGLPWSFTVYKLESERLVVVTGFFNKKYEEIQLYRIVDITLKRNFRERLFRLGTIILCSSDRTTPRFEIKRIKNSIKVNDLISRLKEEVRTAKGVTTREILSPGFEDHDEQDAQDEN